MTAGAGRPIAVVGEFRTTATRSLTRVDADDFNKAMASTKVALPLLAPDGGGRRFPLSLRFRRVSDMEPESIANQCVPAKQGLDGRAALTSIKGPLGCDRAVIVRLRHALDDERARDAYRESLSPGRACSAADVFRDDAYGAALRGALASFVLPGETEPYIDSLLAINRVAPDSEGYPVAWRGLAAMVAQLLHPEWLRVPPLKEAIERMISDVDARLSAFVRAILHEPSFRELELAWRVVRRLVEVGDVAQVVSCPFDTLAAELPGLLATLYPAPRAIAVLHGCDPRVDADWMRPALAAAPPDAAVVFQLEEELAGRVAHDLALQKRVAHAFGAVFEGASGADRASLCLARVLVRHPFGDASVPVKAFHFEEFDEGAALDPRALAYAPAAPFRAAALRPAAGLSKPTTMTPYERAEGDALIVHPVFTADPFL
ncbi:MAG: type VI secretion system contractile sheath large subunit [Polyangiaceae bacterium]